MALRIRQVVNDVAQYFLRRFEAEGRGIARMQL